MVRQIEDNRSYPVDDGVAIDSEGYVLTYGTNGVDLAAGTDPFVGVSYRSTNMLEKDEGGVEDAPVSVQQSGQVLVLCEEGAEYEPGDELYISATDGVADGVSDTNTKVGVVTDGKDLSGADEPDTVVASITGQLGP